MKNYIEGLKRVNGGGDIQKAQNAIEIYFKNHNCKNFNKIEEVAKYAEEEIKNIFAKYNKFETKEAQNVYWCKNFDDKFKELEKLLDATYSIIWTKQHQPKIKIY